MRDELIQGLDEWVRQNWPEPETEPKGRAIPADGSRRVFVRYTGGGLSLVGLANPGNPEENRAWLYFARHLLDKGLPVPRVLAESPERGYFLMTDLGMSSMRHKVMAVDQDSPALEELFEPVLAMLARLQARGHQGLDLEVCFSGKRLSPDFLLEYEFGYFLREFAGKACCIEPERWPRGLNEEIHELSRLAGEAEPQGLVHRDFQWRNIIWGPQGPGLVDFQGARLGPAQYDLAALLHEAGLGWQMKERLKRRYLELRGGLGPFDIEAFERGWPFVSLSRILQALGAFAYLSLQKGLPHLYQYARPHIGVLGELVAQEAFAPYPALRSLAQMLPREFPDPAGEAEHEGDRQ